MPVMNLLPRKKVKGFVLSSNDRTYIDRLKKENPDLGSEHFKYLKPKTTSINALKKRRKNAALMYAKTRNPEFKALVGYLNDEIRKLENQKK